MKSTLALGSHYNRRLTSVKSIIEIDAFPYQIIIISIFQIEHLHFHNQINLFAIKYSIQFPKSEAIKFVF